jgi:hypothetical protein
MGHDPGCPLWPNGVHSDAAKRCSDAVNLHLTAIGFDAVNRVVAIRLADGGSDHVLYDNKRDAVRAQSDEQLCAYVFIPPNGMNQCRAESFMITNRKLYDAGFRLADPDSPHGGRQVIPRITNQDQARAMSALRRGRN